MDEYVSCRQIIKTRRNRVRSGIVVFMGSGLSLRSPRNDGERTTPVIPGRRRRARNPMNTDEAGLYSAALFASAPKRRSM